ncbi:hypothetical protein JA1_003483 [Spathaspora sp. JA1]|nr:hypothetical protein JA1_003483 [Spathaspora sp. JA1]
MVSVKIDNEDDRFFPPSHVPVAKKAFYNVKNLFDAQSNATESSINTCTSPTSSQANRSGATSISSYDKNKDPLKLEVYERKSISSFDLTSLGSFNIDFDSLSMEKEFNLLDQVERSWEEYENEELVPEEASVASEEEFETVTEEESIMESIREYTMMEKFKALFTMKRPKDTSQINFPSHKGITSFIKQPLLAPGVSRTSGPIDMSIFQNPSEESSIYQGNIRFKSNADYFVYETSSISSVHSPLDNNNKYPGLANFNTSKIKRKFSMSCISKTLTIPRFSNRKEFMGRSLSLPKKFAWPSATTRITDHKSILKTKLNKNYEVEARFTEQDDEVELNEFLENFENSEKQKSANESSLNSLRIKQVQNYYHNYS